MAITANIAQETLTKKYQTYNFTVTTPPDSNPTLTVVYGEYVTNSNGTVVSRNNQVAILTATKQQMIDLLPANNEFALPNFTGIYTGLRGLFEKCFVDNFSGQFLS